MALTLTSLDTRYDAPDAATITAVLASLDGGRHVLATLGPSEHEYVQAAGSVQAGFTLEYQEGSLDQHYRSRSGLLPLARVTAVFQKYAAGDGSWRQDVEWERVPHVPPKTPWFSTWIGYTVILVVVIALIWLWRGR
jgi:hypothetical protein